MDRWASDAFPSREAGSQVRDDVLRSLQYTYHPLFDWRPLPNQTLPTVCIDAHGLRSVDSPLRPADFRCVVVGGSFAWGFGASSNTTTPAALIAMKLSQSMGGTVTAVNLADQAYCSIQEIKSFVFTLDELQPDLVICVTGVNDAGRGRQGDYKREPRYVANCEFLNWGIRIGLLGQFAIPSMPSWKKAAKVLLRDHSCPPYPGQPFFSFTKPPQDEIPLTLLSHKVDLFFSICARRRTKLAFVLQPLLLFKQYPSTSEAAYLRFIKAHDADSADHYFRSISQMRTWFSEAQGDEDATFIDSTPFFDDHPEAIFFDGMHVSDHGYSVWTEELCRRLSPIL